MTQTFNLAKKADRKPQPPLRTLQELAEEFGITANSLRAMLSRNSGTAPACVRRAGGTVTAERSYYNHRDMRAWWASRPPKKAAQ